MEIRQNNEQPYSSSSLSMCFSNKSSTRSLCKTSRSPSLRIRKLVDANEKLTIPVNNNVEASNREFIATSAKTKQPEEPIQLNTHQINLNKEDSDTDWF